LDKKSSITEWIQAFGWDIGGASVRALHYLCTGAAEFIHNKTGFAGFVSLEKQDENLADKAMNRY
jgi:hypothetical protein